MQQALSMLCQKLREFELENKSLYSAKDYDNAARKYWKAMYFGTMPQPKGIVPHRWKNVYDEQGRFMRVEVLDRGIGGQFNSFDYSSFATQLEYLCREVETLGGIRKVIIDFHKGRDWEMMTIAVGIYDGLKNGKR